MEEQTIQTSHHQTQTHHQVEASDNWIYMVAGAIFLLPLLWTAFGTDVVERRHPYNTTAYSLNWYLTFLFRDIQGLFLLCLSIFMKPRYYMLRNVMIIWPVFLILDHVLFYGQSPTRHLFSVIFMTYIAWYHNRYEIKNHIITIIALIGFSVWFYVEYDHRLHFINYMDYMINPRFVLAFPACYILWYFLKIENWRIWQHG